MVLRFSSKAKKLKAAWEKSDYSALVRLYDQESAEYIADALDLLNSSKNLNDVMHFKQFRPHTKDNGTLFSLSLNGRKRLTIKTLDANGNPTKKIDFSSTNGLILEVTEHYGD